jgi:hypothetical protein
MTGAGSQTLRAGLYTQNPCHTEIAINEMGPQAKVAFEKALLNYLLSAELPEHEAKSQAVD